MTSSLTKLCWWVVREVRLVVGQDQQVHQRPKYWIVLNEAVNFFSLAKSKVKLMTFSDVVRFVFPNQGAGFFFSLVGGEFTRTIHCGWINWLNIKLM